MIPDQASLLATTGCADEEALSAEIADQIELDCWLELHTTGLTVVTSNGCTAHLAYPFAEHDLWAAVSELDDYSAQELDRQEAETFAWTHVLAHCDPHDGELYGVWLWTGEHVDDFYPGGEMCAEHQYAEALILTGSWVSLMERLPRASPYFAHWIAVPMIEGETAEEAFRRLDAMNRVGAS